MAPLVCTRMIVHSIVLCAMVTYGFCLLCELMTSLKQRSPSSLFWQPWRLAWCLHALSERKIRRGAVSSCMYFPGMRCNSCSPLDYRHGTAPAPSGVASQSAHLSAGSARKCPAPGASPPGDTSCETPWPAALPLGPSQVLSRQPSHFHEVSELLYIQLKRP